MTEPELHHFWENVKYLFELISATILHFQKLESGTIAKSWLGHQPLYVLKFLFWISNFYSFFDVLSGLKYKNAPNNLILQKMVCMLEPATSLQIGLLKQCRDHAHFMFRGWFGASRTIRKTVCAALWRICLSNKGASAKRKKDFHTNHL